MIQLGPNPLLWPEPYKSRYAEKLKAAHPFQVKSPEAIQLEQSGWQVWLRTLFPRTFTKPFAPFHSEFWDWYWPITLKRARGERLSLEELICLYILGRGSGKSTNVEAACIAEGALIGSGYVLYICSTEDQARDHLIAIKSLLESSEIARYYPGLANPELGKHGFRRGWSQEFLATQSGWGMIPAGLEEGIRGGRKDWMRFTLICPDDVDDFNDSPAASAKKLNQLSRSVVPAGTEDTLILFPQNIIHENSVMNQIYTRRTDVFSTRKVIGPHPSFKKVELVLTDREDGARVWDIEQCESNWEALDVLTARKFLAKSGRLAFMAEYQHDFEAAREGRVLRNWSDSLMVITKSDFARVFGSRAAMNGFNKWVGHDFARTKSAYHAPVMGKLAVSSQNTKLPGKLFLFDLMTFDAGTQVDDMAQRMLASLSPGPEGSRFTWTELIEASLSRSGLERFLSRTTDLIAAKREVLAGIVPPLVAPVLQRLKYQRFVGSHDQNKDGLQVMRTAYGLPFLPVNPGESGGLEWADHYMTVDRSLAHPFFTDELLPDGKWKLGCPGLFLVVDDNKYRYPSIVSPETLCDEDLCRYQFDHWRMRPAKLTEAGLMEYGPMKMWDDFGQMLQMILTGNDLSAIPLTYHEKVEEAMTPHHRAMLPRAVPASSPMDRVGLSPEDELALLFAVNYAKKIIDSEGDIEDFDDYGNPLR